MRYEATASSTASPERLWAVLTDVEHWPEAVASYVEVRRLDEGPLRVGSRAEVKQHRLAKAVWEVTELDEGRRFVWVSRTTGTRTTGWHEVVSRPDGGSELHLGIEFDGWLSGLVGLLFGRTARRYVDMEVTALAAKAGSASS